MMQVLLIGLSAGVAAALLSASVASGSPISMVLFYLAPLPILIAALGWSHWAALVAAVAAAAGLAAVFNDYFFFIAFLIGIGLPAWWLGYLALLARPVDSVPGGLEWYPSGHLVVWAAILGTLVASVGILYISSDEANLRAQARDLVERAYRMTGRMQPNGTTTIQTPDAGRVADLMLALLPPTAAVFTTATTMLNLWLASRVVRISGRLNRPPSDLSAMRFPVYAPALIGAAVVASFLPGQAGSFGVSLTASMLLAYAILGLAVMHAVTRGMNSRPYALGGLYAAVIVFSWPIPFSLVLLSMLGLADTALDLRGRAARRNSSNHPQI